MYTLPVCWDSNPPRKAEQLQRNLMGRGKCKNANKYHSLLWNKQLRWEGIAWYACFCGIWYNCKLLTMFFASLWTAWWKQQLKANQGWEGESCWWELVASGEKYCTPNLLNYALCCKIPNVDTQTLFLLFCLWWLAAKKFKSHPHSNCPAVTKSLLSRQIRLCRQNLCSIVGALGRG